MNMMMSVSTLNPYDENFVNRIYNREITRMENKCGNCCPDWYEEECIDVIEESVDESGNLDREAVESYMIDKADDYIQMELEYRNR